MTAKGNDGPRRRHREQERAIQTGREGMRAGGFARRAQAITRANADLWTEHGDGLAGFSWSPQVEIFRRGDTLVVRADLPGLRKDEVRVEIDNGFLTLSGERCDEHGDDRDGFYRTERTYGRFLRSLPLPSGIGDERCVATFKDGVLEVTLSVPKGKPRNSRQIPIR
jgi:HSP20 family molecular chaperone IbpA